MSKEEVLEMFQEPRGLVVRVQITIFGTVKTPSTFKVNVLLVIQLTYFMLQKRLFMLLINKNSKITVK